MLSENQIYLASRSPRRRELLRQIGVKFNLLMMRETLGRTIDVDEQPLANEVPADYIYRITRAKADAGWKRILQRRLPVQPVLAADTIVTIDGCILGKPRDNAHAEEMLKILSGRSHQVLTAIGVGIRDTIQMRLSVSTVRFREISEREIRHYLANNNEMKELRPGDLIEGVVITVTHGEVLIDVGAKSEGIVSGSELEEAGITIFQ